MASNPIPREALERNIEAAKQATHGPLVSWRGTSGRSYVGRERPTADELERTAACPLDANAKLIAFSFDPVSGLAALSRRVMELEDALTAIHAEVTEDNDRTALGSCVKIAQILRDWRAHAPTQETT